MKVLKFGGSSMLEGFENVKKISVETSEIDGSVMVVVSAFKGVTDTLLRLGRMAEQGEGGQMEELFDRLKTMHFDLLKRWVQSSDEQVPAIKIVEGYFRELEERLDGCRKIQVLPEKIKDIILSFGEKISAVVLTASLLSDGKRATKVDAMNLIRTNDKYGNAEVIFESTNKAISNYFRNSREGIYVVTGFIGSAPDGSITTLGRGGSDYTAAIFAAALNAEEIQLWKETDGVLSADPKKVNGVKSVPHLTQEEMRALAVAGAKIVHPPAVRPAEKKNIPIKVFNTFNPSHPGTLIDHEKNGESLVKVVSSLNHVSIITISGSAIHEGAGVDQRVATSTAKAGANVLMKSQANEDSICFVVSTEQEARAVEELSKTFASEIKDDAVLIESESDHAILAVVGEGMKDRAGVSARLFTTLAKSGVSAHMIAQDAHELCISVAVPQSDLSKALQVVHDRFVLDRKIINLYLVGPGRVGKEILKRIQEQKGPHLERNGVEFRLAGVINSSRMLIAGNGGIHLEAWEQELKEGEEADLQEFVRRIVENNLPHSIMVDCTASDSPVSFYPRVLEKSVAVVTPNKRALSGPTDQYREIKKAAKSGNTIMGYETNVGAALPVIGPLRDAIEGGDEVIRIDGMLSGTLGYIFSVFDGTKPFSEVVREAYEKGYTEPNPADDLNLSDVARKIVILARETGAILEREEVEINSILPDACLQAKNVEEFFAELKKVDDHFLGLHRTAKQEGKRLRVIERFENGKASIRLMMVGPEHPAFHLEGSKNLVAYTTRDYEGNTWEVRGAGAGIGVTANGVIADIMKAAKQS